MIIHWPKDNEQALKRYMAPRNPTPADIRAAFEHKFIPEPNSGCWIWIGPLFRKRGGYGAFTCGRDIIVRRAHVFAWELYRGATNGLHVLHTCDMPCCVNPDHLWLGTQSDNMRDKAMKGRQLQGDKNPSYKHGRYVGDKKNPAYP